MGRRELLLAVAVAALAALLAIYLLKPQAGQPAETPAPAEQLVEEQPAEVPAEQPEEQPHVEEQPLPQRLIIARVEAGEGGRVLANGTEVPEWSSHEPFTLVLEAVPERCMVFSVWEVNGTEVRAEPATTIRVAGNTTVRAFFARPVYRVVVAANITGARVLINSTPHDLPLSVFLPACTVLEIKPGLHVKAEALNSTLLLNITGDTSLKLYYRELPDMWYVVPVLFNGTVTPVKAYAPPDIKGNAKGTLEVTDDGWIHISWLFYLQIYIPWNYTHVVVEARNVTGAVVVKRLCPWGWDPFAYGDELTSEHTVVEFNGCRCATVRVTSHGKRYPDEEPGVVVISPILVNSTPSEAWLRITASP